MAKVDILELELALKGFQATINGLKKAGDETKKTKSAFAKFGQSLKKQLTNINALIPAWVGVAGAIAIVTQQLKAGFDESKKLEEGLNAVKTLLPKDTDISPFREELARINGEMGAGGAENLTRPLYDLISASVPATESVRILEESVAAAKVGLADTGEAVDTVTTAVNAFGLQWQDSGKVFDTVQAGIQQGKFTMSEFSQGLSFVAPVAAQLGGTLEQVSAATATLTKQGFSAQQSMRGLRQIYVAVLKNQERAAQVSPEVAEAFSQQALEAKGLQKFLADLEVATGGNKQIMAELLGSAEALSAGMGLMGTNADRAAKDLETIAGASGLVAEKWDEMKQTPVERMKQLSEQWKNMRSEIAGKLLPIVVSLGEALLKLLTFLGDNKWFIASAALMAALVALNAQMTATSITVVPKFIAAMAKSGIAMAKSAAKATLALGPWGLILAAITAAIAAFDKLMKKWEESIEKIDKANQASTKNYKNQVSAIEEVIAAHTDENGQLESLKNLNDDLSNKEKKRLIETGALAGKINAFGRARLSFEGDINSLLRTRDNIQTALNKRLQEEKNITGTGGGDDNTDTPGLPPTPKGSEVDERLAEIAKMYKRTNDEILNIQRSRELEELKGTAAYFDKKIEYIETDTATLLQSLEEQYGGLKGFADLRDAINEKATEEITTLTEAQKKLVEGGTDVAEQLATNWEKFKNVLLESKEQIAEVLSGLIFGTQKLLDVVKDLAKQLLKKAFIQGLQLLLSPAAAGESGINSFGGFFRGLFGFANGGITSAHSLLRFADGGISSANNAVRFVNSPELFNAGGRMGVRGEAGEEAIIPAELLKRMGNKSYNITINSSGYMSKEAEKQLANTVKDTIIRIDRGNL